MTLGFPGKDVELIKNSRLVEELEKRFIVEYKLSYKQALKILESMWEEANHFGVLRSENPLEGIEVDIRMAKALNICSNSSFLK